MLMIGVKMNTLNSLKKPRRSKERENLVIVETPSGVHGNRPSRADDDRAKE